MFAGFPFEAGPRLPDRPGVFVLTEDVNGFTWPLYVGEGDSVVNAAEAACRANPELARQVKGFAWLPTPVSSLRLQVVRALLESCEPPFNRPALKAVSRAVAIVRGAADKPSLPPELAAARLAREMKELVARF